jgi:hypothetical protein
VVRKERLDSKFGFCVTLSVLVHVMNYTFWKKKKKKTAVLVGPVPTCRVFGLRITIFDKTKKCNPGAS